MTRKKLKTVILLILIFISSVSIKLMAQADINMSTHWYNRGNYNPAAIARTDYLYIFANARTQWIGVNGAPKVLNIQLSDYYTPLRSAFGLSFVTDKIGVTSFVNPMFTYAYRISNDIDWSLSMGLSAGIISRNSDLSLLNPDSSGDIHIDHLPENTIQPDANVGVEFQNNFMILGISSTHLLSLKNPESYLNNSTHFFGYAIYKNSDNINFSYFIGSQFAWRNNLFVAEGNATIKFKKYKGTVNTKDIFDIGLAYRTSKVAIFSMGIYVTEDLRIAYAYDKYFIPGFSANETHEIMFEYRIPLESATPCISCSKQGWYR